MGQWCFTHPWMTFFIVLTLLETVGTIFNNIIRVSNNKARIEYEKSKENKELWDRLRDK